MRSETSFIATSTSGWETSGEPILCFDRQTWQWALPGTHFGAVGRQPADVEAFAHSHLGEELAEQEYALPAEASDFDLEFFEVVLVLRRLNYGPGDLWS